MSWWSIVIGLGVLGLGGFGIYRAVQNPMFFAGLAKIIFDAIVPIILKRKSPEEEKLDNEAYRRNQVRPTKIRKHPDEGGHR